jgi:hypothetical protein
MRENRRLSLSSDRTALVKEMFQWVLIGTLIILSVTTLLTQTGLGAKLGQDQEVLFFLQVISALASIVSALGLIVTQKS